MDKVPLTRKVSITTAADDNFAISVLIFMEKRLDISSKS